MRIGADQSMTIGSNTTYYRWELNERNLDIKLNICSDNEVYRYILWREQSQEHCVEKPS